MELKEDARAWLVNSWHIVFRRRPSMGEEFLVKTWPYKFKGVFGMRNFLMESMDGEALVYARPNRKTWNRSGWGNLIQWNTRPGN